MKERKKISNFRFQSMSAQESVLKNSNFTKKKFFTHCLKSPRSFPGVPYPRCCTVHTFLPWSDFFLLHTLSSLLSCSRKGFSNISSGYTLSRRVVYLRSQQRSVLLTNMIWIFSFLLARAPNKRRKQHWEQICAWIDFRLWVRRGGLLKKQISERWWSISSKAIVIRETILPEN